MEVSEDVIDRDVTLTVLLPEGTEETTTVHGSKPVMDVLVTLCGEYHLNPSEHAMELLSPNQNLIKFKPNSLIGSLEAERVVLRHKGEEDRIKKRGPYVPEVSVRLLIFYRTTHRAVVRVSPKVPLSELLPAICGKCEFTPETTLLFLNSQSEEPLDLTKSLNDHGIREVFAKDTKVINLPEPVATPDSESSKELPPAKEKNAKGKENKGFFNFFRIAKKKPQKGVSASAPTTPLLRQHRALSLGFLSSRCSGTLPSDKSKKRRAPLPPMLGSLSYPANLNASTPALSTQEFGKEITLRRVSSTESTLKRTKRRAPPPPALPPPPSPPPDTSPEDSIPQDASGNLAPVRELPEEPDLPSAPNEGESIRHLTTALVHPSMNGTGANQCEELHSSNEPCEESCCVCTVQEPEKADQLREPTASSQASASPRKPSAPYRHASLSLTSSSGRLLRSGGSMREGLTTFTVIPKQREKRLRTYQVQVVLESPPRQKSSEQPPGSSEEQEVGNVEPSSRSTGNVEHKAEDSESTNKGGTNSHWVHRGEASALEPREDWRPPAMMPKPSVPFWAAQRMSVGHSSLMKELQRRVPVLDYQNTEEEEEEEEDDERRDKERQQQGKKSVGKDEEEENEEGKEDRVKDEKEEKGGEGIEKEECTSSKERIEQEMEEEEEEEEQQQEEEKMDQEEGEEKGEDDEGFDGSEKESTETDEEGGGIGGEEEGKEKEEEADKEEECSPPPVIWKECDGVGKYSPSEAKHYPVDLPSAPALVLASPPGPCSSSRLSVSESPSVGGLSLFALAVSQRAQRLSQAFNACASPRTLSTRIQQYRPGHMSPSSNGSVPADLH